ncbi:hypothetical protein BDP27DRAFT_1431593 [Rhodocollybia butyracea]|uniref:Uncharacterized protein n=1 Tax=Rhodocollybia butyracea TaxID=206335 RepID=A0A9P5TZB2_9AGAR|nr:hypothetical protein BDP27DRAFT_1431593 [Rhodocollybia butyracea]
MSSEQRLLLKLKLKYLNADESLRPLGHGLVKATVILERVAGVLGALASGQAVRVSEDPSNISEMSSAQSSRAPSPSPLSALLASESLSRSMSEDAATNAAINSEQFDDDEVIEVGRGLAMYNYAQISSAE